MNKNIKLDENKIIEKIKNLKNNIIYNMSLGSKELFHSNVWAWLFQHNIEYAKVFFPDLSNNACIEREKWNMDIVISDNGKNYVIENKLKAVPDKSQLDKYSKKIGNQCGGRILVTMQKPIFDIHDWEILDYETIANRFREINNQEQNEKVKVIVDKYIQSIEDLDYILKELENIEELPNWNSYADKLKSIRIWDLYQKYMASKFVYEISHSKEYIDLENELKAIDNDFFIHTSVGYHNGKDTIDFRIMQKEIKGEQDWHVLFGIQIEDIQMRRIINIAKDLIDSWWNKIGYKDLSVSSKDIYNERLFTIFKNYNWFEEYNKEKKLYGKPTKMSKRYCRYGDHEVYQYYDILDTSFDVVQKQIIEELEIVINIFKSIKDYVKK